MARYYCRCCGGNPRSDCRDAKRICDTQIHDAKTSLQDTLRSFKNLGAALLGAKGDDAPLDPVVATTCGWNNLETLVATATQLGDTMSAEPLAHVSQGYHGFRRYAQRMLRALDTGGFTDHVFAVTSILGYKFIPRIRDLPSKRLYVFDPGSVPKELKGLIGGKVRERTITANWPDILRSAATMVAGIMPPSQLLKNFASHPRQHDLAIALREIGRVVCRGENCQHSLLDPTMGQPDGLDDNFIFAAGKQMICRSFRGFSPVQNIVQFCAIIPSFAEHIYGGARDFPLNTQAFAANAPLGTPFIEYDGLAG